MRLPHASPIDREMLDKAERWLELWGLISVFWIFIGVIVYFAVWK